MDVENVLCMVRGSGETSYAANSKLQEKAILAMRPMLEETVGEIYRNLLPEKMVVADLGCSSGPNTLLVVSEVIKIISNQCLRVGQQQPEIQFFLNDLCNNDFNNIFQSLDQIEQSVRVEKGTIDVPYFVAGLPGSFYGRLFPRQSVHFFHSSLSLHWISQIQQRRIMNIFKKKVSAKEALKTSKREMDVAKRNVEREIASLQLEEKKLVAEIKRTAQPGNEAATRILARQLVRLRQQITNLQRTRAQIRGVATHTQAIYATTSISTGMKGANKAMAAIYKLMEPDKQLKIMKEFFKQSTQLDTTIEMISETIDETLDKDSTDEETEFKVLDEIGVDVVSQLSSAPKGRIAATNKKAETVTTPSPRNVVPPSSVGPESSSEIDDLEKRLASLRQISPK